MKTINYFLTGLILASTGSFAQITFEKGYIITLKGDTVKGEIKLNAKKEIELYSKILFKLSETDKKNYTAAKISGYCIHGQTFVSTQIDGEKVFLRKAAEGKINFYEYQYEESSPQGDASIVFDYYVQKEGKDELVKIKESKFRKQLSEIMSDNKEIVAELEDKKNGYNKIVDIVKKYNAAAAQ